MSIGEVLRVRAAMKPIATVPRALKTIDVSTGEPAKAHHQRSDVCAVPAAGVVAEAMVALVLAEAVAEKFGGDSVAETPAQHARATWTAFRRPWTRSAGSAGQRRIRRQRRPAHRADRARWPLASRPSATSSPSSWARRSWIPTSWSWKTTAPSRTFSQPAARRVPGNRGTDRGPGHRRRPAQPAPSFPSAAGRSWTPEPSSCWAAALWSTWSADAETVAERIARNTGRPLLAGDAMGRWHALFATRQPVYERLADLRYGCPPRLRCGPRTSAGRGAA